MYRNIANDFRTLAPLAAENLDHWLSKRGTAKTINASYFRDDSKVRSVMLNSHRKVFLSEQSKDKGIVKRINKDRAVGKVYSMKYKSSLYASLTSPNLLFGLGGFTLNSYVQVKVLEIKGNTAKVRFVSWHAKVEDTYNWDVGKSTPIPGYGIIPDEWAKCLEKAGRAKSFQIESNRWNVRDKDITADAIVTIDGEPGDPSKTGIRILGNVTYFSDGMDQLTWAKGAVATMKGVGSATTDEKGNFAILNVPYDPDNKYDFTLTFTNPHNRRGKGNTKVISTTWNALNKKVGDYYSTYFFDFRTK